MQPELKREMLEDYEWATLILVSLSLTCLMFRLYWIAFGFGASSFIVLLVFRTLFKKRNKEVR